MNKSRKLLKEILSANNISFNFDIENIYVDRVALDRKDNVLRIYLFSDDFILESNLEEIMKIFEDKFSPLKVDLSIRYVISEDLQVFMKKYWSNILFQINKNVPSSKCWLDEIKYNLKKGNLTIYSNSEGVNYALKSNKIDLLIKDKIKRELNLNLDIIIDDSKAIIDEGEFIERTENEEREISVDLLSSNGKENKIENENLILLQKDYVFGKKIEEEPIKIKDIQVDTNTVTISGEVFSLEFRDIKEKKKLATFNITDLTDSITAKVFLNEKQYEEFNVNVHDGSYVKVQGNVQFDNFMRCTVICIKSLNVLNKSERIDTAKEKRVELHLHTQMSAMDGVSSFTKVCERAKKWGHKAIAITDHGVVQGFLRQWMQQRSLELKLYMELKDI